MCIYCRCSVAKLLAVFLCASALKVSAQHTPINTAAAPAGPGAAHDLPGQVVPSADALLKQLTDMGAEANVAVTSLPGVGRVLLAPRDIQKGDVLVRLPIEMTYDADDSQGAEVAARQMLVDMAQEDHPLSPYFRTLPGPSEVMCAVNMPITYLPILQDTSVEFSIRLLQAQAEEEWNRHSLEFWQSLGPAMTVSNITYAMALAWTRRFNLGRQRLIPLADLGNHRPGCKHGNLNIEPCQATPALKQWAQRLPASALAQARAIPRSKPGCTQTGTAPAADTTADDHNDYCVIWRAGESVAAGEQVCYPYKHLMLQDMALLRYGFLQDGPLANELSMLDRPDRVPGLVGVWQSPSQSTGDGLPAKFTGTPEELQAELDRLTQRLAELSAGEAKVAAVTVDKAADPKGTFLAMMLEWRRQRLGALAAEINRIKGLLLDRARASLGVAES